MPLQSLASALRRPNAEAANSAAFASIGENKTAFVDIKLAMGNSGLLQSWNEVLEALGLATEQIVKRGEAVLPTEGIQNGLSVEEVDKIRTAGCVVVKGVIPKESSYEKKTSRTTSQLTQERLKADTPSSKYSSSTAQSLGPIPKPRRHANSSSLSGTMLPTKPRSTLPSSNLTGLRIRQPADSKFALGARMSMPMLNLPTLARLPRKVGFAGFTDDEEVVDIPPPSDSPRPTGSFVRSSVPATPSLKFADWNALDLETPVFPGSTSGAGLEMTEDDGVDAAGRAWGPGILAYVYSVPGGTSDSSVFYVPAVPLTLNKYVLIVPLSRILKLTPSTVSNTYLRDQGENFIAGQAGSELVDCATAKDIFPGGRVAMSFDRFGTEGEGEERTRPLFEEANRILTVY
ncbi:hypothetical protein C8F01DRAFT_1248233 [Mycena amicta]|nr:hypothetical protein C8F01DRAFT_1248233 [Mycena amicta]